MLDTITALENELNSFDSTTRTQALETLNNMFETGQIKPSPATLSHNLHCHTFFSYNGYGFSPSYIVWLAKKAGHFAVGSVDFDVLDAVNEFLTAAELLGVRAVCGLETRVFIHELADKVINSPGEPGVAYHMGMGFNSSAVPDATAPTLAHMRETARARTKQIVELVNGFLPEIALDFVADAEVLTPAGNVTERHVCEAFRRKAEKTFPQSADLIAFWSSKLAMEAEKIATIIADAAALEALIRAKTMKSGGVGYVQATPEAFPSLESMNSLTIAAGALPTIAWLNGESAGESDPDALLELHIAQGAAALNIIPDRNWNFADPDIQAKKINELKRIIAVAKKHYLPIVVGTEMNAPGLKLVDDFDCPALAPYTDDFVDGAAIIFAHTLLTAADMGYLSKWAAENFANYAEKYQFYAELGRRATADKWNTLTTVSVNNSPAEVAARLKA